MSISTQMSFLTPAGARITIRELPTAEPPPTRLSHYGPAALSSAELSALVLGLAETLLAHYQEVSHATFR